jgi:endonuclease-3
MVNRVTERLFRKYKTVDDYLHADIREFEQDIRQTGFYRNKAKHILQTARILHDVWHNQVPHTMKELITLPGVARKTANVVLSNAFGKIEGIAVDTHVLRISQRLRFVDMATIGGKKTVYVGERGERVDYKKDADPNKIEAQLMRVIDKSDWHRITYMIIDHGRAVCKAQNPKCKECSLNVLCPSSRIHT